ncbi:hypothetical protein ACWKSP_15665 [Micromonosporaceae bacterium Da 78-11]
MDRADLSPTEQLVFDAFPTGVRVDVSGRADRVVRAEVLRFLLLGGRPVRDGELAALRLVGVRVTGVLDLTYAETAAPISLRGCQVDERMDLYGTRLRRMSLTGCTLAGLTASNGVIDGGLGLVDSTVDGEVNLVGARIDGPLILAGSRLSNAGWTIDASRMTVTGSVIARDGLVSRGAIRLDGADITGSLLCDGAELINPGQVALKAAGLRVGDIAQFTGGFTAAGSIVLSNARIGSLLSFKGAVLTDPAERTIDLRNLVTRELVLLPAGPLPGVVDLGYAEIGLLRDDPASGPERLRLAGLTYQALPDSTDLAARLRWLHQDEGRFRPQAYSHLAATLRRAGRDDEARAVLLAGERHRRQTLKPLGRFWSALQDLTVGYGYQPARAAGWLFALLLAGTVVFSVLPPRAAEAAKAPGFHASAYAADLLLPVIDLGQQSAYLPRGWTAWFAYLLIGAGLLFVTTTAAAVARRLRRT